MAAVILEKRGQKEEFKYLGLAGILKEYKFTKREQD